MFKKNFCAIDVFDFTNFFCLDDLKISCWLWIGLKLVQHSPKSQYLAVDWFYILKAKFLTCCFHPSSLFRLHVWIEGDENISKKTRFGCRPLQRDRLVSDFPLVNLQFLLFSCQSSSLPTCVWLFDCVFDDYAFRAIDAVMKAHLVR